VNKDLVRAAISGIRDSLTKAAYRKLLTSELLDLEVYVAQIAVEIETATDSSNWLTRLMRKVGVL